MNAINDALRPFGAKVFAQPFTPERILAALGKVPARWPMATVMPFATGRAVAKPAVTPPVPMADAPKSGLFNRVFGRS